MRSKHMQSASYKTRDGVSRTVIAIVSVFALVASVGSAHASQQGTLKMGYSTGPTSLDPARSTSGGDRVFLFPVYDRLIRLTNEGDPQPQLATKWSFSADGKSLDLTLRQDVKFHDGTPLNADAVKRNLERSMTMEGSTLRSSLSEVRSVDVIDEYTVRLTFKTGGGSILRTLGDKPGMMASPAAFNADLGQRPVGTGQFVVADYRPDDRIIYAPYESYYDSGAQTLEGLEVVVLSDDATRLNALRSGQIDMTFIRPYQVPEARSAGLKIQANVGLIWYYMGMNIKRSKFGDVRVRRALNLAANRGKLTKTLLQGFCAPSSQPVPKGVVGHADSVGPDYYEYDPAKAKRLLAEAGLPNGFTFTAMVVQPTLFVQIAEVLQADFAKVGVNMQLKVAPIPQVNSTYFGKGNADAYVGIWLGQNDPSAMVANLYMPNGFFNPSRYSTPRIQQLYRESVEKTDPSARQAIFDELIPLAVEEAYRVGVCNVQTPIAYRDKVLNVKPGLPTWQWDFRGIRVSK